MKIFHADSWILCSVTGIIKYRYTMVYSAAFASFFGTASGDCIHVKCKRIFGNHHHKVEDL